VNDEQILVQVEQKISKIEIELSEGYSLQEQNKMVLQDILKDNLPQITGALKVLTSTDENQEKDFGDVAILEQSSKKIYEYARQMKEDLELDIFFSKGYTFDTVKLTKIYHQRNLAKKFPNFKLDRYLELLNKPLLEVTNFAGKVVKFDPYWVRKNAIAINQMIFNEMDLYILNIGKEGSGKSCWSSQQILYFYKYLTEIGLIDYEYNIKKMFFADILSFLEEHAEQKNKDYFRIETLDEGNDLNRSNFRNESNKQFKYEMRTDRRMLRITMINMQQIGELGTSISLSRVNFIYDCKMKSEVKSGTLEKGFIEMYVIPRGYYIYSHKAQRNISRSAILNAFAKKLDKKKDYYVNLPSELIVKTFKFYDVWGFDKDSYDEYIKDQMRKHKFGKEIKLTENQAYIFITKFANFKHIGTFDLKNNSDKKMYTTMKMWFKKIETYFALNPDKINAFHAYYKTE